MKAKLTNIIKYSRIIYFFYYYIVSALINILKIFIKPDDKLILFNSFAGRNFDDSPREIFEQIKKDVRFNGYRFVWAFHDPGKYTVDGAEKVKTDTMKYFFTALKSRLWITNSTVERGLNFKGKNTIYFNTWHGTPIKLMGSDIAHENKSFSAKGKNKFDIMNSQSRFETEIFSRTFGIPRNQFLECGLPRNDVLATYTIQDKLQIRKKFGIEDNKKVILYAPTFREFEKDEAMGCVMAPPMNLKKWEEILGGEYVLLFRAHYEVAKVMDITENDFVKNMTQYPLLNELMICADILISDYSSVFFDYSITGKPMIHFTYDYEKYASLRGMYFDIRDYVSGGKNEDEVISILKNLEWEKEQKKTENFRKQYVNFYGNATMQSVDYIASVLDKSVSQSNN